MLLKILVKGLLGRVLAYGVFGLGLWLLFQGFLRPSPALGVLGGGLVLGGMYLMVVARRVTPKYPGDDSASAKEDRAGDPLDGCHQGHKLPP